MSGIMSDMTGVGSDYDEAERRLAHELRALLLDTELWTAIEAPYGDGWSREAMAERALRLYDFTASLAEIGVEDSATPFHYAIGAVRDTADACAILSRRWSDARRRELSIPDRSEIEAGIVLGGAEEWAFSLGEDLSLSSWVPPSVASEGRSVGNSLGDLPLEQFAVKWSEDVRLFRRLAKLRVKDPGSHAARDDDAHDVASGLVAGRRLSLILVQQSGHEDLIGVELTGLLAAQGLFIASWAQDARSEWFPSDELLRRILKVTGGLDWLIEHGAEIPPELSA